MRNEGGRSKGAEGAGQAAFARGSLFSCEDASGLGF
jgi:hypothetical protein